MRYAWTVDHIRAAEAASADLASGALMQRAADAVAETADISWPHLPVLILAGPGDNGADGLWAGERLANRGRELRAYAVLGRVDETAASAFVAAGGEFVDHDQAVALIGPDRLIIDAIFGIGARPGLPSPAAELAMLITERGAAVLAVDLPSGLDADRPPQPGPLLRADTSVTFGGLRICHLLAEEICGQVQIADIGIDLAPQYAAIAGWTPDLELRTAWPVPGFDDDKYSRGVVGIDTGSARYPGAAVLSCSGAAWSGAGMIRYLGDAGDEVTRALPNVTIGSGRVQAWLLGSGWGDRPSAQTTVRDALAGGVATVLDAEAITALPIEELNHNPTTARLLLTPHAGELAQMLGVARSAVESDPIRYGREAAERSGATVLLKGAISYVFSPSADQASADRASVDQVRIAVPGPAWTAQAGSGDVLAGICGTLLASGLGPADAALAAASLQALTARLHPGPYPPQELARFFPLALRSIGLS